MISSCRFSADRLKRLRDVACRSTQLAALYTYGSAHERDCDLAALFASPVDWSERLDLELAVGTALGIEAAELANLKRIPLVMRYAILKEGDLLYVGRPEVLAVFIEQTVARYLSLYSVLEALYWRVETGPLSEDTTET